MNFSENLITGLFVRYCKARITREGIRWKNLPGPVPECLLFQSHAVER